MQATEAVKLSGEWVGICEALAWVLTRDGNFTSHQGFGSRRRASLVFAAWLLGRHGHYATSNENGDVVQAEADLTSALRHGRVSAMGIPGQTPGRPPTHRYIETFEWARLRLGSFEGDAQPLEPTAGIPFHDLLFKVRELVRAFPPSINAPATSDPASGPIVDLVGQKARSTGPSKQARQIIEKRYPDGIPPADTKDAEFLKTIRPLLPANGPSEKTVTRVWRKMLNEVTSD